MRYFLFVVFSLILASPSVQAAGELKFFPLKKVVHTTTGSASKPVYLNLQPGKNVALNRQTAAKMQASTTANAIQAANQKPVILAANASDAEKLLYLFEREPLHH